MIAKKNILMDYLKEEGIHMKHFARRVGISYPTLRNILNNHSMPTLIVSFNIEKATRGIVKMLDWLPHDVKGTITKK